MWQMIGAGILIQFVTDEKGRNAGVPIDLKKHGCHLRLYSTKAGRERESAP
jgi:hypothetical protein